MASFSSKTFSKYDDYMTPKKAWGDIKHIIPSDKIIWEPFYGDGKSGEYLRELGFNVIHKDEDFFKSNEGDVIVTNPPFSLKKDVLERLIELDKPFILIMPCSTITTNYFIKLFRTRTIQIMIPRKRIQFAKMVNGEYVKSNQCNFDCFYFCYKIGLEKDIIYLN